MACYIDLNRKGGWPMIEALLHEFMLQVGKEQIEIYNEFSLQHELGIFLRERLQGYKVQFERNTKYFGLTDLVKHEIDIVVYDDVRKYAVELKYPLNGQHPEQMFSFVKDICFMEQLKMKGFEKTYCMTVVKDKKFYSGTKKRWYIRIFQGPQAHNRYYYKTNWS